MLRKAIKGKRWITVLHYLYQHYHLFSRPVTHSTSPSVPHNGKNVTVDSWSCRFSTTEKLFRALYRFFSWNEFIAKTLFWTGTEADLNVIIFKKLVRLLLLFDFKCAEMIYHWENYFTIPALTRFLLFPTSCFWYKESGFTLDLIWLLISRVKTLYRIICVQYEAQQRYKEWNIISEHFPLMLRLK